TGGNIQVGKRKQLKPLMLSGHRGLHRVVVHLESGFVHLHAPVTRASYFRRRYARRSVYLNPIAAFSCVWVLPVKYLRLRASRFSLSRKSSPMASFVYFFLPERLTFGAGGAGAIALNITVA
ncbi:hypothetical protein, partial [Paraburkholderia sediminicola]|uniref:hypothetical protein n=2 Tax=Paraburkholderia TaxID=1822464 RepID=UPI0038B6C7AF